MAAATIQLRLLSLLCALLLLHAIPTTALARVRGSEKAIRSVAGNARFDTRFWAPNRIGTYLTNNGALVRYRDRHDAGMEWPVGSGKTVIFASGIWLAGRKAGEYVSAAAEYGSEFQPGTVQDWAPGKTGTPADAENERFRLYMINRKDIRDPFKNPDYLTWPAEDGAPVDNSGKPLLVGTSTAWAVFNDFDQSLHDRLFASAPMGVLRCR